MSRPVLLDLLTVGDECWISSGWHNSAGYPYGRENGKDQPLHRILWRKMRGEIPHKHDLDHLCRNVACVNPDHHEAVTHGENIRRGRAATKMACKLGHDWTNPRNVYVRNNGRRWCAECARTRWSKKRVA